MNRKTVTAISLIIIAIGAGAIAFINFSMVKRPIASASLTRDDNKIIVQGDRKSDLGFERSGKINFIAKKIGDTVSEGEILAKIDDTDAKMQYAQAQAGVSVAEADLAALENSLAKEKLRLKDLHSTDKKIQNKQIASVENNIESQQARVRQAMDALVSAKSQLDKCTLKAPFSGAITRQNIELGEVVNPNVSVITITGSNK